MDITQRYERWSGSSILSGRTKLWKCGWVRFMALVLKTSEQKCSVSSNLTASAKIIESWMSGLNRHPAKVFSTEKWNVGSNPTLSASVTKKQQFQK